LAKIKQIKTDFIQCESTENTIEIHRGRNGYNWTGQKGKILEWTIPVLVENSADEILNDIYNCEYWQTFGKGKETSYDSPALREFIWHRILPFIDIKNMKSVDPSDDGQKKMIDTQLKGKYVIETKKDILTIGSNECYTFYQSVEMVSNWFLKNVNKDYFKNKILYMNADDTKSAFWLYFYKNFEKLGLKEIIATHYDGSGLSYGNSETDIKQFGLWEEYNGYILRYDGKKIKRIPPDKVKSNFHGDYKEKKCMEIARNEADIIITNPPFGKEWEQYVKCMLETGKTLIFWGNGNASIYTWFMPYLNEKNLFIIKDCSDKYYTDYYMTPNMWKKRALGFVFTTEDLSKICIFDKKNFSTKNEMLKNGSAWYARLTTMSGSKWKKNCKDKDFINDFYNKNHNAPYEAKYDILCCDKGIIPIDTDEILAVSINVIKNGILNLGYEIIDYRSYCPIKGDKKGFVRVLIQKIK